jgi:hypothetical protein
MILCSFLLDKNIFVGANEKELCSFVAAHTVILPETLFYECYTDQKLSDKKHFNRLEQLLKAGAYATYQLMQIIADEGKNLSPCSSIVDYNWTDRLRSNLLRRENTITKEDIAERKNERSKMAISIKKLASKAHQILTNDQLNEIRRLNMGPKERFCKWFEIADKNDIHDLATKSFCKYVTDPKRFCLSTEWLSWHDMRLMYAFALEYSYLQITGSCPKDENAEHDSMDIEYLTFLAKCDTLLTGDKKLQDLAEVAFPNKKVYSRIQEICG